MALPLVPSPKRGALPVHLPACDRGAQNKVYRLFYTRVLQENHVLVFGTGVARPELTLRRILDAGRLWLEAPVSRDLPLTNTAHPNMRSLHGDLCQGQHTVGWRGLRTYQRNPAELEPGAALGLHDLGVVAAGAHVRAPVTLLGDLVRASEHNRNEEAEILRSSQHVSHPMCRE